MTDRHRLGATSACLALAFVFAGAQARGQTDAPAQGDEGPALTTADAVATTAENPDADDILPWEVLPDDDDDDVVRADLAVDSSGAEALAQSPEAASDGESSELEEPPATTASPPVEISLTPEPRSRSAEPASEAYALTDPVAAAAIEEVKGEARRGFDLVARLLEARATDLESRARSLVGAELIEAIEKWEASRDREATGAELQVAFGSLRARAAVDLLAVVTAEDEVFWASEPGVVPVDEDGAAAVDALRDDLRRVAGLALAAGEPRRGASLLRVARGTGNPVGFRSHGALHFVVALPVYVRPDAPSATLVSATPLASLSKLASALLEGSDATLAWQVFTFDALAPSTVVIGPDVGRVVRPELVDALRANETSSVPAFDGDLPAVGRWGRFESVDGQLVGGWGVTVDARFVAALVEGPDVVPVREVVPPSAAATPSGSDEAMVRAFFIALAVAGGVGLIWVLGVAVAGSRRRRRALRELPSAEELGHAVPSAPTVEGDDLLTQFELNWKTFASYTQDRIDESLKNFEQAPHTDVAKIAETTGVLLEELQHVRKELDSVREQNTQPSSDAHAQLASALVEIKNELSIARDELKNSSNGVVRRLTAVLKGQGAGAGSKRERHQAEQLERIEADLSQTRSAFQVLNDSVLGIAETIGDREDVDRRVQDEVTRVTSGWEQRVEEFTKELEHVEAKNAQLEKELEETCENERALRVDLEEVIGRENRLVHELEEERAKVELSVDERESAGRRERDATAELERAEARVRELEESVQTVEGELRELEDSVNESRRVEEELRRDLEETRRCEAELREELERQRSGDGQRIEELEGRIGEVSGERDGLRGRIEALEQERDALQTQVGDDPDEKERLRSDFGAASRELETLRKAFDALKAEREHFEHESKRLAGEAAKRQSDDEEMVASLRAEVDRLKEDVVARDTQLNHERQRAQSAEERVDGQRSQLADRDVELARKGSEIEELREQVTELEESSLAADAEELQQKLVESGRELRDSLEERLRLNTKLTELEAHWQSRISALELQVSEADRQLSESKKRLSENDLIIDDLRGQLEARHAMSRTGDSGTLERLQNLKREKADLVRTLDQLKEELERSKEQARDLSSFHGALIDGNLPAAIVACDPKRKVFAWSAAAARLWGISSQHAEGRNIDELDLGAGSEISSLVATTLRRGSPVPVRDISFNDPAGGQTRHLRIGCDPIKGPNREVIGAVVSAHDVTDSVDREVEARLQSLFAESLSDSLPSALVVVDARDRVTSWNRAAEELFKLPAEDALGRELFSLKTVLRRAVFRRRYEKAKEGGRAKKLRVRIDRKGGPVVYLVTQAPFRGRDESVRGTLLLVEQAESVPVRQ